MQLAQSVSRPSNTGIMSPHSLHFPIIRPFFFTALRPTNSICIAFKPCGNPITRLNACNAAVRPHRRPPLANKIFWHYPFSRSDGIARRTPPPAWRASTVRAPRRRRRSAARGRPDRHRAAADHGQATGTRIAGQAAASGRLLYVQTAPKQHQAHAKRAILAVGTCFGSMAGRIRERGPRAKRRPF